LVKFLDIKARVTCLHPLFLLDYPVVIVDNGFFNIYDVPSRGSEYQYIKSVPVEMPVPAQVRAAFPLTEYAGECCCVVSPDVFKTLDGYVSLLHECVHCYQYMTCETELKNMFEIAQKAQKDGNYMWEIDYPFPYNSTKFQEVYTKLLEIHQQSDETIVRNVRDSLFTGLGKMDREYMIWQEWKEGFARYLENKIRVRINLPENQNGKELPFDRVVFYTGGAAYIAYLQQKQPGIIEDIYSLYQYLSNDLPS
jgi:hypothetical protein